VKSSLWPVVGETHLSDGQRVCIVLESIHVGLDGERTIEIERPDDPGELLQGWCNRADPSIPIPYWAEIWPASRAIARRLAAGPSLEGQAVLDLGCGLGLAGIAAGLRGGAVTFLDYDPDALAFARRNAARAALTGTLFLAADWKEPAWARPFDLILGADVIYDRADHPHVAHLMTALLADGGTAWLGEPGREGAASFLTDWSEGPDRVAVTTRVPPQPGDDVLVAIHELRLR